MAAVHGTAPDLLARRSLPAAWAANRAVAPQASVLHDPTRGWLTNADLERESAAVAGRLHAAGLRPGDRFLMSAASSAGLVVAHIAALRLGLVVVPTNTAYREREIAHIVNDADPVGALVDDDERAAWIRAARPETLVVGVEVALEEARKAREAREDAREQAREDAWEEGRYAREAKKVWEKAEKAREKAREVLEKAKEAREKAWEAVDAREAEDFKLLVALVS